MTAPDPTPAEVAAAEDAAFAALLQAQAVEDSGEAITRRAAALDAAMHKAYAAGDQRTLDRLRDSVWEGRDFSRARFRY